MKTLEEATDWHDMNAYVQRLEGHMYEHDVKIYQKSRKNLLYNVSKVACDGRFQSYHFQSIHIKNLYSLGKT